MADHPESSGKRSTSRTRTSRPTTPLRPSSRSSFRESARESVHGGEPFPLNTFEPAFAELSDAMADLEANMMHFQLMHESLARFSESFASFLYGLNMNAFCVDYPENLSDAQGSKRSRAHIQDHRCFFRRQPSRIRQADPEIENTRSTRLACAGSKYSWHFSPWRKRRTPWSRRVAKRPA
uniref:DASH complex subunit DAM1 n=1 Tax=Colletotrichum fructicola (strain Nara gc5) TaxID=1213859 RepID=L2FFX5_COLFN